MGREWTKRCRQRGRKQEQRSGDGEQLSRGAAGLQVHGAGGHCRPASGPRAAASRFQLHLAAALRLVRGCVCTQRPSQAGNSESKRPDHSEPGAWALVFRETDGKHRTQAWEAGRGKLLTLSQADPAVLSLGEQPPPQARTRGMQATRPPQGTCVWGAGQGQGQFTGRDAHPLPHNLYPS